MAAKYQLITELYRRTGVGCKKSAGVAGISVLCLPQL